jgi:crotonobetainyl-CoA:carnitine CoA-transferase CaiB-like acyl-CoA transferase
MLKTIRLLPTDTLSKKILERNLMTTIITPNKYGSRNTTESIWSLAALPLDSLSRLKLTGNSPVLPTSFQVGVAAQSSIAVAALAATELEGQRNGKLQSVSIDMKQAELECTGYFIVNGKVPESWAPLSGLYPCKDGYVRIHANFNHHRDGALKILGLNNLSKNYRKEDVSNALSQWAAIDYETAAAEANMVVSAARSFSAWDKHPHAKIIEQLPLITFEKIGEAEPLELPNLAQNQKALAGLKVVDLTRILAGPVCGRTLAAYGADVMLVNSPELPNIEHIADTSRGKISTLLDLNKTSDNAKLLELVRDAHIFVQGYRPGGLAKLGFSPEQLAEIRPGLSYVTLSAYGHQGPWSNRRGFDSLVQTATGFNFAEAQAAESNSPRALPVQILDYASGFLMAFAAQAAVLKQQKEGGSWHARISLVQTAHWLRSLGRITDNFHQNQADYAAIIQHYSSNFGELGAIPHAAIFSDMASDWTRPSSKPGTDAAEWPE